MFPPPGGTTRTHKTKMQMMSEEEEESQFLFYFSFPLVVVVVLYTPLCDGALARLALSERKLSSFLCGQEGDRGIHEQKVTRIISR